MPPRGTTGKRKRQYQHIKESELEAGRSADVASEIAARTVNKQRASTGEAREVTPGRRRPLATERKRSTRRASASRKATGRKMAGGSRSRSTAAKRTSGTRKSTAASRKRSSTKRASAASRTRTAGRKK
ncbi:MAG TPA: hypothetical protein VF198_03410 [Vicinamibacterales bacterium]